MRCMAQEGSEASVASSPPHPPSSSSASAGASWWRDMHPYSSATPAWPPPSAAAAAAPRWPPLPLAHHQQQHQHRTSSSGAEDDMQTSFTTNHSGISMDESSAAAAAAAESHLWNQVLMGAGGGEVARSMQAVHDAHGDDSENFLELLNSRTLAPELFAEPPACDYLKKMEYGASWAPPPDHQFSAASMEKHHQQLADSGAAAGYINALAHHQHQQQQQERGLTTANLSDLVSNWSIAPPSPCHGGGGAKALFLDSGGNVKHEMGHGHGAGPGMLQQEAARGPGSSGQDLGRPVGAGLGSYSPMLGLSSRMYGGAGGESMVDVQWAAGSNGDRTTSLSDLISFGGAMGKQAPAKTSSSGEYKTKMPSPAKTSSGGGGGKGSSASSGEGKKKRSEEQQGSEGSVKKSKQQQEASSPTSSLKGAQVPKVKLGDKINALQQIVSPFGKACCMPLFLLCMMQTDTASVLYEAINYIKWLHEQVQLLSDPYMKSSSSKDYNPWGGLDRKEKADAEADLRSRGLCLVPVSCTPQVYRDSNGPDYWTPPYRSCLYR